MRVHLLGTRGSTPAPGPDFVRYGGHTSCVAISGGGAQPALVIDAGTGIRNLTPLLGGQPFKGSILLGHFHWDHTQGLPFFRAGDHPDADVTLYAPSQGGGKGTEAVLARAMSPPHFPIRPSQLRGHWRFRLFEPGEREIEGFSVLALEIPHKGGRSLGYRVSDGRATLAYVSDHCPTNLGPGDDGLGEYHDDALRLAKDADLVVHDAQYTDEELPARANFGHSSPGYAVGLAVRASARRVLLYHHDPARTDPEIDAMTARYRDAPVPVEAAVEGSVIEL